MEGKNYSAMVVVLPHILEAPEIKMNDENSDFINNNDSVVVTKWEEDSTDPVKLTTFLPMKETSNTERIMKNCYMKGKIKTINQMFYLFPFRYNGNDHKVNINFSCFCIGKKIIDTLIKYI